MTCAKPKQLESPMGDQPPHSWEPRLLSSRAAETFSNRKGNCTIARGNLMTPTQERRRPTSDVRREHKTQSSRCDKRSHQLPPRGKVPHKCDTPAQAYTRHWSGQRRLAWDVAGNPIKHFPRKAIPAKHCNIALRVISMTARSWP